MKRGFEIFFSIVGFILMFTLMITINSWLDSSMYEAEEERKVIEQERKTLRLDCKYDLVSLGVEKQLVLNGKISSAYLLCIGGTSGNIKTSSEKIYEYWYKREDGGMIGNSINMNLYDYPQNVTIVIYENDTVKPKVEFWRNYDAREEGDGETYLAKTEIRFTVPTGSVVDASFQRVDSEMSEYSQMNGQ